MRGEWIEIIKHGAAISIRWSLPMRGEWIEMVLAALFPAMADGLSPCGESGLKFVLVLRDVSALDVSPHAGRVD